MSHGSRQNEWPLPWFISPFDVLVQRALMDDPPRERSRERSRPVRLHGDLSHGASQQPPLDDDPRTLSIDGLSAEAVALFRPPEISEEQMRQARYRAELHNFWLGLAAVALQQQAASVSAPTEVATRAARLARLPEGILEHLQRQPATTLLGWVERVEQFLAQFEPAAVLVEMDLAMFVPALVGAALRAGLADSLLVPASLVVEVAGWLSMPQTVTDWLSRQSETTVRGWVDRLRAHYGLPDTR